MIRFVPAIALLAAVVVPGCRREGDTTIIYQTGGTSSGAWDPLFTNNPTAVVSDPTPEDDFCRALAVDGGYLYAVGSDLFNVPPDSRWRVEKRSIVNGAVIWTMTTDGAGPDEAWVCLIAGSYLFIGGSDRAPGNDQWRVEKRRLDTGALETAFDTDGIVTFNPSGAATERVTALASDGVSLFIGGYDFTGFQWQVEKRNLVTGALDGTFGTAGLLTVDPSGGNDGVEALAADATHLYIAGSDDTGGGQWRIEKRLSSTGALETAFDGDGIVTVDPQPGAVVDVPHAIAVDGTHLYVAGIDQSVQGWRIEKRRMDTGAPDAAFGTGGFLILNPTAGFDRPSEIAVNSGFLYVAGWTDEGADSGWRLEKRSAASGALDLTFAGAGFVVSNPSANKDECHGLAVDATSVYLGGFDRIGGPSNARWRIEKLFK